LVDPDHVAKRLERLGELLAVLEAARAEGRQALDFDARQQLAVLHALQLAIQACIDAGAHLVGELGLKAPDDYADVFRSLAGAQMLDPDLAERLANATGLRNVIVHEYMRVDLDRVWNALAELDDLRAFARAAARVVDQTGS